MTVRAFVHKDMLDPETVRSTVPEQVISWISGAVVTMIGGMDVVVGVVGGRHAPWCGSNVHPGSNVTQTALFSVMTHSPSEYRVREMG